MDKSERVLRVVTSNEGKASEFHAALDRLPWRVERVAMEYQEVQAEQGTVKPPFVLEDAGLFVDVLDGFPGVYSAYVYRAVGCDGILRLMEGRDDRKARFESRIALVLQTGPIEVLQGVCIGTVPIEARGTGGFGFDPVFVPEGEVRTFAQMGIAEKETHSHRGRALARLIDRLAGL